MADKQECIFDVMAKIQADMKSPTFDKVNPHFENKYASLGECERVVKNACKPYGVFFDYDLTTDANGCNWVSTCIHWGDQSVRKCPVLVRFDGNPQARGSELTYARRYSLCGAWALAADEDDDANAATAAYKEREPSARDKLVLACDGYAKRFGMAPEEVMVMQTKREDYPSRNASKEALEKWYLTVANELNSAVPMAEKDIEF